MTTPARTDERPDLATVSLATLKYLRLDPADVATRALVAIAQRYRLDPLVGEVALIKTQAGPRVYISRDGMIAIAHRSGQLDGIVVNEERRSTLDDGWTCYVSVYRKDCTYPFKYGAQCKDTEPQARAGNGPEMALARAERRALKRAFAIPAADAYDPSDTADVPEYAYDAGAGTAGQEPAPADALAAPAPAPKKPRARKAATPPAGALPPEWPAKPVRAESDDVPDMGTVGLYGVEPEPLELVADPEPEPGRIPPRSDLSGRLQGAAHRTVASWGPERRDAFLAAWGIEDFGEAWPLEAVDGALEEPF